MCVSKLHICICHGQHPYLISENVTIAAKRMFLRVFCITPGNTPTGYCPHLAIFPDNTVKMLNHSASLPSVIAGCNTKTLRMLALFMVQFPLSVLVAYLQQQPLVRAAQAGEGGHRDEPPVLPGADGQRVPPRGLAHLPLRRGAMRSQGGEEHAVGQAQVLGYTTSNGKRRVTLWRETSLFLSLGLRLTTKKRFQSKQTTIHKTT